MSGIRLTERGQGREILKKYCRRIGISVEIVTRLLDVEQEHVGRGRRHGLYQQFDEILGEAAEGETHVPATDSAA